jgi:hypothetical protein
VGGSGGDGSEDDNEKADEEELEEEEKELEVLVPQKQKKALQRATKSHPLYLICVIMSLINKFFR